MCALVKEKTHQSVGDVLSITPMCLPDFYAFTQSMQWNHRVGQKHTTSVHPCQARIRWQRSGPHSQNFL